MDPATRDEWQAAADAAKGMLAIDAARQYGLITGGPTVDVARCEDILARAYAEWRIKPKADAIDRVVRELADQHI